MSDTKININPAGDELTIRHGDAKPIENIEPVVVTAGISAPLDYFNHVEETLNLKTCYVQADVNAGTIKLLVNPQNELSCASILGRLQVNPLLTRVFKINTDASLSKDEFVRTVKMNRHYFHESTDTYNLLTILEKLSVKIEKELTDEGNKRGTYNQQARQAVKSEIPEKITLLAPIFVDEEPVEVVCEIDFEIVNNKVQFYLISPDMEEYRHRVGQEKLEKVLVGFGEKVPVFYL